MPVLKVKNNGVWEAVTGGASSGGASSGGNIELDTSLSISGMAADAKAVGDAISSLSVDIEKFDGIFNTTANDNDKVLTVVNGSPAWQSIPNAEEDSF